MSRLGAARKGAPARPAGTRVLLDLRPLQDPPRSPETAIYLEELLRAFAADPLAGEELVVLTQLGRPDPTEDERLADLPVVGRRTLPPSRALRSGALTTDPFLLRGASLLPSGLGAIRGGAGVGTGAPAAGPIFHTASGSVPIASRLPVVVTLLDLAPWQLPESFQRSPAARFGQRLRARILRDARIVIVPSPAAASAARRLLRVRSDRLRVVPLAPRAAFGAPDPAALPAGLGLPPRYLLYPGRFDARHDLDSLFRALAVLALGSPPPGHPDEVPWPPRVVLAEATPDDRASVARAAQLFGVGDLVSYLPHLPVEGQAAVVAGARAVVLPVHTSTTALQAIEATAAGTPVVGTSIGSLPDAIGPAGLLVAPADARRLATALAAIWSDEAVHASLAAAATKRAKAARRTWSDVAEETRRLYAEAARGA